MFARVLYFARAESCIAYLLPLTIECPTAAVRLNKLQGRWAHVVLFGAVQGLGAAFSKSVKASLLGDLGWAEFWDRAIVAPLWLECRLHPTGATQHFDLTRILGRTATFRKSMGWGGAPRARESSQGLASRRCQADDHRATR